MCPGSFEGLRLALVMNGDHRPPTFTTYTLHTGAVIWLEPWRAGPVSYLKEFIPAPSLGKEL